MGDSHRHPSVRAPGMGCMRRRRCTRGLVDLPSTRGAYRLFPGRAKSGAGRGVGMRRTAKWPVHAIVATLAVAAGVAVLAYIADAPLRSAKINDFYSEAWPAYIALAHGHVVGFLTLGPVYVGSLGLP